MSLLFTNALCHGQTVSVVGQWDTRDGGMEAQTNGVTRWVSPQALELNFCQTDWETAAQGEALRNVGGPLALGLCPGESASNATFRAAVFVLKPEAFTPRAALLTGYHVARLANRPGGSDTGRLDTLGPASGTRIFVDGVEGAPLREGEWQTVSCLFPSEISPS